MTFFTHFLLSLSLVAPFFSDRQVSPDGVALTSAVAHDSNSEFENRLAADPTIGDVQSKSTPGVQDEWQTLRPRGARAEFQMPVKPRYVERKFSPVEGREPIVVKLYLGKTDQGQFLYVFSYHDMLDRPRSAKKINDTLEGAVRGSLATVNGTVAEPGVTEITYQKKYPGRQFAYNYQQNGQTYVAVSRIYLVGGRQYQLTTLMHESAFETELKEKVSYGLASKYINSFKLYTPEPDLPPVPRNR